MGLYHVSRSSLIAWFIAGCNKWHNVVAMKQASKRQIDRNIWCVDMGEYQICILWYADSGAISLQKRDELTKVSFTISKELYEQLKAVYFLQCDNWRHGCSEYLSQYERKARSIYYPRIFIKIEKPGNGEMPYWYCDKIGEMFEVIVEEEKKCNYLRENGFDDIAYTIAPPKVIIKGAAVIRNIIRPQDVSVEKIEICSMTKKEAGMLLRNGSLHTLVSR